MGDVSNMTLTSYKLERMWLPRNGCHLVYEYMLSNVTITDLIIIHKTRSFDFPLDFTSKFSLATISVRIYHFKKYAIIGS